MKRIRRLCAILCLVLMLFSSKTIAENNRYKELCSYENIDYTGARFNGHPVFIVTNYGRKSGLFSGDGQLLAWLECDRIVSKSNGYFVLYSISRETNNAALLTKDGKLLTESKYAIFDIISESWVAAIQIGLTDSDTFDYRNLTGPGQYIVTAVDIYHIGTDSTDAKYIGTLSRSQYFKAKEKSKDYLLVQDRNDNLQLYNAVLEPIDSQFESIDDSVLFMTATEEEMGAASRISGEMIAPDIIGVERIAGTDDRYWIRKVKSRRDFFYEPINALMDADGNILTDFIYRPYGNGTYGYCVVSDGQKRGLLRLSDGKLEIECQYNDILLNANYKGYIHRGYIAVELDGKIGYIDIKEHETCPAMYSETDAKVLGCTMYTADPANSSYIIIIAADGTLTNKAYTAVSSYSDDGYYIVVKDESGKNAIIDWHGDIVFPFTEKNILFYGNDCFVIDNTLYRIIQ